MINRCFNTKLFFAVIFFLTFNCSSFLCAAQLREDHIKSILKSLELAQKQSPEKYVMSHPGLSRLFKFSLEEEPILLDKELRILNHFIRIGNNINLRDGTGKTALMYACRNLNPYFVKWLLDHGANPRTQNIIDGLNCFEITQMITTCDVSHVHQGPCTTACWSELNPKRIARSQKIQHLLQDSLKNMDRKI